MSNSTASQNSAGPIDLLGYLKRLGRYWIAGLTAAVLIAGALLVYGTTRGTDLVGTTWAKAYVMVTMPEPKTEALGAVAADASTRVLASYVAVSDSDVLINDTMKRLNDGSDALTLKAATSLYTGGGSQIMAVYALGTDQAQAEKRADAYTQALVDNSATLLPPAVKGLGTPIFTGIGKAGPSSASPDPLASPTGDGSPLLRSPVVAIIAGLMVGLIVMGGLEVLAKRRRN